MAVLESTFQPASGDNSSMDVEKQLSMGCGRPLPPQLPDEKDYVVEFDGPDDPYDPMNGRFPKRAFVGILASSGTLCASINSAMFAPAIPAASTALNSSEDVTTLGTTLFVLGFVAGPILWAPFSEMSGRRWPLTLSLLGAGIFTIGSAAAKDIQTLLLCRFFAGICGSSSYSIVPAVLSDLFDNALRGGAITIYSQFVFTGPFIGPIMGGFLANSSWWRWTLYIPAILSLLVGAFSVYFLPETYAPCLLARKAADLRRQSGIWGIHAQHEHEESANIRAIFRKYFTRPLWLLCTELTVFVMSLYMSILYALVYTLLEAYTYIFSHVYGMGTGPSTLPFAGPLVGVLLACVFVASQHTDYVRRLAANDGVQIPEWRLRPARVGSPILAVGFFWFGWTAFTPSIHWAVPSVAGIFIGFGTLSSFLPCFQYLVDAYLPLAASTVAATVVSRSVFAAGFSLFAKRMFANMGVQWACMLLGVITTLLAPVPFAFHKYGRWLRLKSKNAIHT